MKLPPKKIRERFDALRSARATWESHWQEVMDYIQPNKNNIVQKISPGNKRNLQLLDNTAMQSNELLAGALHGLLTNPNAMWFELTSGDEELDLQDVPRKWLQKTAKQMHNVLNNSNFQTEVHELYLDLCSIGTSAMSIEEDDQTHVRFGTKDISEVYMSENNKGYVDEVYRKFKWNARQIVSEFGEKNVSQKVREAFVNHDDQQFEIVHAVYPDYGVKQKRFKYLSQYILLNGQDNSGEDFELRFAGFREFPYVTPRWSKSSGEIYGRGPGMTALPDAKMLNKMTETTIRGAQKVVDPPLQLPDDGFILPLKMTPAGLNFFRAGTNDRITPILNDARIDFGFQAMKAKQQAIREAFYVDQLQLNQGPQMTATEVLQRTEEKMRLLGPMLGRQQAEFLRPLIDRLFEIMLRRGLIDRPPKELQGRNLDVQYSSMIAKAQRLTEGQNILRTVQAIAPFAQVDPAVMDIFDGDQAAYTIAKVYGCPQNILRSQSDIKKIRAAKAQAQQEALQQQQQSAQADSFAKVAPGAAQLAKQMPGALGQGGAA